MKFVYLFTRYDQYFKIELEAESWLKAHAKWTKTSEALAGAKLLAIIVKDEYLKVKGAL